MASPQRVIPASGRRGSKLTVRIEGDNLTPCDDVSFGKGVAVLNFRDVARDIVEADIVIGDHASIGRHNVLVTALAETGYRPGGFFDVV